MLVLGGATVAVSTATMTVARVVADRRKVTAAMPVVRESPPTFSMIVTLTLMSLRRGATALPDLQKRIQVDCCICRGNKRVPCNTCNGAPTPPSSNDGVPLHHLFYPGCYATPAVCYRRARQPHCATHPPLTRRPPARPRPAGARVVTYTPSRDPVVTPDMEACVCPMCEAAGDQRCPNCMGDGKTYPQAQALAWLPPPATVSAQTGSA